MKMFKIITLFILVLINLVAAQVSGFWWLDPNLATFGQLKAPEVKFEEGVDNGTDETDKIVFTNDDHESGVALNIDNGIKDRNGDSLVFEFPTIESDDKLELNETGNVTNMEVNKQEYNNSRYKDFRISKSAKFNSVEDVKKSEEEILVFPSDNHDRGQSFNYFSKYSSRDKYKTLKEIDVESICTFISQNTCFLKMGKIQEFSTGKYRNTTSENDIICCVLPVKSKSTEKSITSNSFRIRFPRSVINTANKGQIQRETLLKKIIRPTPTTVGVKKIVNDYDYVDPYWNIKNSNIKTPVKVAHRPNPYDVYYDTVESEEDYTSELPKPGFLGVYGQVTRRPLDYTWGDKRPVQTFNAYGFSTGYHNYFSTIDPRLDDRTSVLSVKTRPLPLSVSSSEEMYDAESHIVTYQANPDFQVLQDFKLLNLIKNKTRVHDRNSRKTTTEKVFDYDSFEVGPTRPSYGGVVTSSEVIYDEVDDDDDKQIYEKCGHRTADYDNSDENVDIGTHPWLVLVVRSRRLRSTLCSAVIIHPRAAITAASCVQGATGDIVVRAGEWDLTEIKNSQQRVASIYVHPLFEAGVLNHDLAILHWKRPLRLNKAVQPVCMGDSEVGEKCTFVGWSGSDQSIRSRPRMQHATVIKRRACLEHLNNAGLLKNMPNSAFCATTETPGCVSGLGSALLCQQNGRVSAVGVTVWRKRCDRTPIMLLPIKEWAKQAFKKIGI